MVKKINKRFKFYGIIVLLILEVISMFRGNKRPLDADSKSFKDTTANMTSKEKREYFWEYYKLHVIGTVMIVGTVIWMIHSALTATSVYLDFAFVHGFAHVLDGNAAWEAGIDFADDPPLGIWFSDELRFELLDLLVNEDERDNYMLITQNHNLAAHDSLEPFVMFASVGRLDIIITYLDDLHALSYLGHFYDLTILDWGIPAHMLYTNHAIHLHYFPFLYQHIYGEQPMVLGVATNSEHFDRIEQLFEQLLKR